MSPNPEVPVPVCDPSTGGEIVIDPDFSDEADDQGGALLPPAAPAEE